MYCNNCGYKNEEGNNFCVNCGKRLSSNKRNNDSKVNNINNNNITNNGCEDISDFVNSSNEVNKSNKIKVNSGGIRKEIKKEAKGTSKVNIIVGNIVYSLLIMIILFGIGSGVVALFSAGQTVLAIILGVLVLPVLVFASSLMNFAMLNCSISNLIDEKVGIGEYLGLPFKNMKRFWKYFAFFLLYSLIIGGLTTLLNLVPAVGSIINIVVIVYLIPVVEVLGLMYVDSNCEVSSFSNMFKRASSIVNGHRVEYYAMLLSFIGWVILGIITLGIAFIWIVPYMRMCIANLYLSWTGEKEFESDEKGMSDVAVLITGAVSYVVVMVVIVLLFSLLFTFMFGMSIKDAIKDGKFNDFITNPIDFNNTNEEDDDYGTYEYEENEEDDDYGTSEVDDEYFNE